MANVISCPKCERQLRVPDDLIGQSVKCPSCSETFTAALSKSDSPSGLSSSKSGSRPPRRDEEEEEERPSRRKAPSRRDDDDDYDDDRGSRRRGRRLAPHRGDTIQLLGILSFFLVPLVLGPCAWIMGNGDLAEMDAGRMDPAGRKATETGRMCGKISTIIFGSLAIGVPLLIITVYVGFCCCALGLGGAGSAGGGNY